MVDIVFSISCVVTLLFIWFNTNFIFYYYELLMNKPLNVPEHLKFHEFLYEKSKKEKQLKKFTYKLLSCYKCLCLWLSALVCFNSNIPIVFVSSLIIYRLLPQD
jgi:hypothetical protein